MARPRSNPRSDTRGRILKAAIDEFASHGYDAAGVDRIARRARVTCSHAARAWPVTAPRTHGAATPTRLHPVPGGGR